MAMDISNLNRRAKLSSREGLDHFPSRKRLSFLLEGYKCLPIPRELCCPPIKSEHGFFPLPEQETCF